MTTEADIDVIKDSLMCPVCDNYMCAPIRQCQTGHSICHQCFERIRKCPKCRGPKSDARSFSLEAIASTIVFNCRFKTMGCEFTATGNVVGNHERHCRCGPIFCPFRTYDQCKWYGFKEKMRAHCLKKHKNNFYSKCKQKFLAKGFSNIWGHHYIFVVIHAYNEFFRLSWDLNFQTGITRWAIYYMGTPEMARKFSYKIEFPAPRDADYDDISRNLVWKSPCGSLANDSDDKFVGGNYMMIHRDLLKSYCDENDDLNYTTSVYRTAYTESEPDEEAQQAEKDNAEETSEPVEDEQVCNTICDETDETEADGEITDDQKSPDP